MQAALRQGGIQDCQRRRDAESRARSTLDSANSVLLCFKIGARRANLMTREKISESEIPPAKARRAPSSDNYFLCGLCVFAGDIPNLRLRLCRARFCAVKFCLFPILKKLPRAKPFVEQLRIAFKIIENFGGREGRFNPFHQTRLLG